MHTCVHACIHTCMHTCIHAYMHTCIHAYMHTCMHAYICTYVHTYIHTDSHTYIYIYTYIHNIHTADIARHTHINTCVSCNKSTATNCALCPMITSPGDVVLDPMCGKGTLLAEAAIWWPEGRYIGCETRQELGMGKNERHQQKCGF